MSTSVHASITETHYQLLRKIYDASLDTKAAVQAIADSEARAVEPMRIVMDAIKESNAVLVSQLEKLASERDTYQREAYHLRKDLCEIAAAFNVGVPDSEEAKKRIIAVKAERDQLHATLERTTIAAAQVADRNVALRAEVERLTRRLPPDPGGSDKLDELEFALELLRARAEKAEAELAQCKKEIATAWKPTLDDHASRALTAEAELTKERRRLAHLFHYESPMAEPGDTFTEWCTDIDAAMSTRTHTHNSP